MVALLVVLGAVGLGVLGDAHRRTDDLIRIGTQDRGLPPGAAGHDGAAVRRILGVAGVRTTGHSPRCCANSNGSAMTWSGCSSSRKDEPALSGQVRQAYDRFAGVVTQVVDLIRAGKVAEAREMQSAQAGPLADRLERLTNQLVNRAEVDMLAGITTSQKSHATSQTVVIAFVCGSVALALALGYAISWSLIGPVTEIEARLRQIAGGDFSQRVHVANRDELGALAAERQPDLRGTRTPVRPTAGSEPAQIRVSGQYEPRTAHAAERDSRLHRARAGRDLRRRTRQNS